MENLVYKPKFFVGWMLIDGSWIKVSEGKSPSDVIAGIKSTNNCGYWQIQPYNVEPVPVWLLHITEDQIFGVIEITSLKSKNQGLVLCL